MGLLHVIPFFETNISIDLSKRTQIRINICMQAAHIHSV